MPGTKETLKEQRKKAFEIKEPMMQADSTQSAPSTSKVKEAPKAKVAPKAKSEYKSIETLMKENGVTAADIQKVLSEDPDLLKDVKSGEKNNNIANQATSLGNGKDYIGRAGQYVNNLVEKADGIKVPAANADKIHESLEGTKQFVSVSYPLEDVKEVMQNAPAGAIVNFDAGKKGKYGNCGVVTKNHEFYAGSYAAINAEKTAKLVQDRYGEKMHVTIGNDASVSPKVAEMIIKEAQARKERESAALAATKAKGKAK